MARKASTRPRKSGYRGSTRKTSAKLAKVAKANNSRNAGNGARQSYSVRGRHYCQGIGDCHLLSFPRDDRDDYRVLIDCGVHSSVANGNATVAAIVEDLASETGGHIDLLVITHEHWDHVSGFLTSAEA